MMTPTGRRSWPGALAAAVAAVALVAASGCGQWSSTPVTEAPIAPIPLGPGPVVDVAVEAAGTTLAVNAQGRTVAIAWVTSSPAGRGVRVAMSRDAGASLEGVRELGAVEADGESHQLDVGVAAAGRAGRTTGDAVEVWVRHATSGRSQTAWRSRDGGSTFERLDGAATVPAGVLPQPWVVASADPAGVTLQPPSPLRAAGAQNIDRPALAASTAQPAAVVDDHGALALAWIEGTDTATGFDLVVRRAWVDWSRQSSRAAAFDAPVVVARGVPPDTSVKVARVPGGVVVAWAARDAQGRPSVTLRRVGLDMTCTREQATTGPMSRSESQRD